MPKYVLSIVVWVVKVFILVLDIEPGPFLLVTTPIRGKYRTEVPTALNGTRAVQRAVLRTVPVCVVPLLLADPGTENIVTTWPNVLALLLMSYNRGPTRLRFPLVYLEKNL